MGKFFEKLEAQMEDIMGQWNGEDSGKEEDDALIASEVLDKIQEIKDLLASLS